MAYGFNDDKTKVDLNELFAYEDIIVPVMVNANQQTIKYTSLHIPDGYKLVSASVIEKPSAGTYYAQAIYLESSPNSIGVSIYNASSTNITSGNPIKVRVLMIKTACLSVITS